MADTTQTAQEVPALLRPLLDRLIAAMRPEEVWLFGSRAEGRARPQSDWDLLVVLPDDVDSRYLDPVEAWKIVGSLRVPVDVIPCTRSDFEEEKLEIDSIPRAAFLRGKRLYVRAS